MFRICFVWCLREVHQWWLRFEKSTNWLLSIGPVGNRFDFRRRRIPATVASCWVEIVAIRTTVHRNRCHRRTADCSDRNADWSYNSPNHTSEHWSIHKKTIAQAKKRNNSFRFCLLFFRFQLQQGGEFDLFVAGVVAAIETFSNSRGWFKLWILSKNKSKNTNHCCFDLVIDYHEQPFEI